MDPLQKYVDGLFRHQHLTREMKELKEEILSNMAAKRDDLIAQGLSEAAAIQKAKESLSSIDNLVDGNQLTDIARYRSECRQAILLSCIIFWICSLPLLFTVYAPFSYLGLTATVISGVLYLAGNQPRADTAVFLSVPGSRKRGRAVWIIWGLFFLVSIGIMGAVTFGSNIWFGRPLDITGPYQAASIAVRFYLPLLTIVVPITVGSFTKILIKNKKGEQNE